MLRLLRNALKKAFLSRITTRAVLPLVAVIPPLLLAESRRPTPWPHTFFDWFNPWLDAHAFWKLGFVCWPAIWILAGCGMAWLRDWLHAKDNLGASEIAVLLRALDNPVGRKLKRFGKVAKRMNGRNPPSTAAEVFREITQPDEQILLLAEAIYIFFSNDHNPDLLRVSLARMEGDRIVAWEAFAPHGAPPSSGPEDLRSPDATMSRAAKGREMIIIPNIAKESKKSAKKRKYVSGPNASGSEGSMICFPIVDEELNAVPFVINIKSSLKNHFATDKVARYRFILQRFSERIAMENRLRIIKNATNNQP